MPSEREFLDGYNQSDYERPSVTADVVILRAATIPQDDPRKLPGKEIQVLLVRRKDHPFRGEWALPGGFVRIDESVDAAAERELLEETGISGAYLEQLYTWGEPGRDPRGRVITVSYMALVGEKEIGEPVAGSDAADVAWFSVSREVETDSTVVTMLRSDRTIVRAATVATQSRIAAKTPSANPGIRVVRRGLAFDHDAVLAYAIDRVVSKLEWTDIAFNLLDGPFTFGELQQVYEAILGRKLSKANFRRRMAEQVEPTGAFQEAGAFRPAELLVRKGTRRGWLG